MPISFRPGALVHVTAGIAPAAAFGATVSFSVRRSALSIGLEGRADLPRSASLSTGGELRTAVLTAGVAPCIHNGIFAACAVGLVGSMRGEASAISSPRGDSSLYAAAGARIALELPVTAALAVRPQVDGLVAVARPELRLNDAIVWTAPPFCASFGVGLIGRF